MMILIPTYNSEKCITDTLSSATTQTLETKVLVVDNCSTDNTVEIAKSFGVEVVQNKVNLGRIGNWNMCLDLAVKKNAQYFKILFAGDVLKPTAMERIQAIFENPTVGLVVSSFEIVEKDGSILVNQTLNNSGLIDKDTALRLNFKNFNWYSSPSNQAYRTEIVKKSRFNETFAWGADWAFCIEISKLADAYYTTEVLSEFRKLSRKYYDVKQDNPEVLLEEAFILTKLADELGLNGCKKEVIEYYI